MDRDIPLDQFLGRDDVPSVDQDEASQREQAYEDGRRAGLRLVLAEIVRELGYEACTEQAWILEREAAVAQLRMVCQEFGDNSWTEQMHLGDVIEKHLGRALWASLEDDDEHG